jgi:hypothetical protein
MLPKLIAANIASMLGVAGVLTAVFQLAGRTHPAASDEAPVRWWSVRWGR